MSEKKGLGDYFPNDDLKDKLDNQGMVVERDSNDDVEDYNQSIKKLKLKHIKTDAKNIEEARTVIQKIAKDKNHNEAEQDQIQEEELVILDRLEEESGNGYDIYIARKNTNKTKMFLESNNIETVLLVKYKDSVYTMDYSGPETKNFVGMDDKKYFKGKKPNLAERREEGKRFVATAGSGSEATAEIIWERNPSSHFPQASDQPYIRRTANLERAYTNPQVIELIRRIAKFAGSGSEFLLQPINLKNGENDKSKTYWKLASLEEGENPTVMTLRKIIREYRGQINEEQKIIILLQMFKALSCLAKCGVRHGDLKPGNIFLASGKIVIGDYGYLSFKKNKIQDKDKQPGMGLKILKKLKLAKAGIKTFTEKISNGLPSELYASERNRKRKSSGRSTLVYNHPEVLRKKERDESFTKYDVYSACITAAEILGNFQFPSTLKEFKAGYKQMIESAITSINNFNIDNTNTSQELNQLKDLLCRGLSLDSNQIPEADEIANLVDKLLDKMKSNKILDVSNLVSNNQETTSLLAA